MTATTETFSFAYELSGTYPTGFSIVDTSPSTKSYVDPAATNVKVKDPNGGQAVGGDTLKVTSAFNIYTSPAIFDTGKYTYISSGTVDDHGTPMSGIIVQEQSSGDYFFLTDQQFAGKLNGGAGDVTISGGETTICFMAGTMIRTPEGEVAVETLKHGDLVLTQDGRTVSVDWLGIQTVSLRFADKSRVLPIRIRAGALGDNVPSRDLLVSRDHAILVDGALIHAGALVNGTSIVREADVPTVFTYYHVEVADHSLILAENTPAETFVDNVERMHFDNWAEHEALYPEGKQVKELPYPRAKSQRQVPVRTRVMLADRAHMIGAASSDAAVA